MKTTIIIRTKNEAAAIASTIEGVLDQSVPPHEVIVIDSGSTDDTVDIAQEYPVQVLHISARDWTYPGALNQAAAAATGEILICLSAHCKPASRDWLASMLAHFEDPVVAGVWGPNLREGRDRLSTDPPQRQLPGSYTVETRSWGMSNANSAIRRSLWQETPFDETLPATEDKAWALAMLNQGYEIVFEPRAGVYHASHSFRGAYKRNRAVQAGFGMIFPELEDARRGQLRVVGGRARALVGERIAERDAGGLWHDIKRLPNVISSVIGGLIGAARHRH